MKAAGDGNGDNVIIVRRKNGGKLADAFGVAAPGKADKELAADAKDVATFESGGQRNDASTQFAEQLFVSAVLLLGYGQIDGLAIDEGKFAIDDGWADGTRDGCKHSDRESLHENDAR